MSSKNQELVSFTTEAMKVSPIIASRASSSWEEFDEAPADAAVIKREHLPAESEANTVLSRKESLTIFRVLRDRALFLLEPSALKQDETLIEFPTSKSQFDWKSSSSLQSPSLNRFIQRIFAKDPEGKPTQHLITWIEVTDCKKENFNQDFPNRFSFNICRELVIRRLVPSKPTEENPKSLVMKYFSTSRMKVQYRHSYLGGTNKQAVLDMRCDRASFLQNPAAKYAYDLMEYEAKTKTSDLSSLIRFLLFPSQELHHVFSGHQLDYPVSNGSDKPFLVTEEIFKRSKVDDESYEVFKGSDLDIRPDLRCSFLNRLKLNTLSFSFQVILSQSSVDSILRIAGIDPKNSSLKEQEKAIHSRVARFVATQSSIFGSKVYVGESQVGFRQVQVDTKFRTVSNAWGERADDVVFDQVASIENQKVERVSLRVWNPVQNRNHYTIEFHTYDANEIRKLQQKYEDYELARALASPFTTMMSGEQQAIEKSRAVCITVTGFPRKLGNDNGIRTVANLRDKIREQYRSDVQSFAAVFIQKAFDESEVTYWNTSLKWPELSFASQEEFRVMVNTWLSGKIAEGYSEAVSEERWAFLKKVPKGLVNNDAAIRDQLQSLMVPVRMTRGKHKQKLLGLPCVPEYALAFLCYWYFYPTESLASFVKDSGLFPKEFKDAYVVPRKTGNINQKLMDVFLVDLRKFLLDNFGLDVRYCRMLHKQVWLNKEAVRLGKRIRPNELTFEEAIKEMAEQGVSYVSNKRSFTSLFFEEFKDYAFSINVRPQKVPVKRI